MKLSASLEAMVAIITGLLVVLLFVAFAGGCASTPPPQIRGAELGGTLVLRTPAGPVTVDLGSQIVVADGDGWAVEGYEAGAVVLVDYAGIVHTVQVEAAGLCVVASYTGAAVLHYQLPGTDCAGVVEVPSQPSAK